MVVTDMSFWKSAVHLWTLYFGIQAVSWNSQVIEKQSSRKSTLYLNTLKSLQQPSPSQSGIWPSKFTDLLRLAKFSTNRNRKKIRLKNWVKNLVCGEKDKYHVCSPPGRTCSASQESFSCLRTTVWWSVYDMISLYMIYMYIVYMHMYIQGVSKKR